VDEYEELFADAEQGLYAIDFFKTRYHEHIMRSLRTIIFRARPDGREIALLRAVFIEIQRTVERIAGRKFQRKNP
jgi:tRNA C32,U32 (ribose-2'-O)-methylase TrmJ